MQAFMDDLQSEGLLLYRKGDHRLSPALIERVRSDREARRAAAAAEAARLRRETDIQARLERLFALADQPTEDDAFSLAAWARNPPIAPGRSLADLVMAGDADWRALLSGLSAIERMLEGGALTDELLGLPFEERLEEGRRQAAWIVAQERAAQEEAERRARAGRVVAIREAAWAALNSEAEGWLSAPLAPGAASAIRMSEQSDEGLGAALGALRRHVAELEEPPGRPWSSGPFRLGFGRLPARPSSPPAPTSSSTTAAPNSAWRPLWRTVSMSAACGRR